MPPAEPAAEPPAGAPAGGPLPVLLHLAGRRCVVVGGGAVAARRARSLLEAGAAVAVVAEEPGDAVRQLAAAGRIELVARRFEPADLDGAALAVAATGDAEVDALVGRLGAASGVPVNRADDGPSGDLSFPATVRRGPVSISVGTAGRAPAVSAWLASVLDEHLDRLIGLGPEGYGTLVELVEQVRAELRERNPAGTGVTADNWRTALDASILDLIDQGRRAEAKERLLACLSSS